MESAVRSLVYSLKYRNYRAGARELGWLLADCLETERLLPDVLTAVPLHPRRERERGYNQSELLARELSKLTGIPVDSRLLRSTRNTPPQVSLQSPEERRRNIEGAFECSGQVDALKVLVIDDVVTTGNTMFACAAPLKAAGAATAWGLALARQA